MEVIIIKVIAALLVASIIGLIKLYRDVGVQEARINSLQAEVDEMKEIEEKKWENFLSHLEKKFEKVCDKLDNIAENYVRKE